MSMAYVRKAYGVPAKRGMRVKIYRLGQCRWHLVTQGRITSASHYIHVGGLRYHPTDNVVYLATDGSVLCDTRDKEPHA